MEEFNFDSEQLMNWVIEYGIKAIAAIIILIVGWIIINVVSGTFRKALNKRDLDESLKNFLTSMAKIVLRILLILTIVGMAGVKTTSFIAVIGAASLAIGLALQGTLQNFAGGVIILFLKPFRTGDYIEVDDSSGTVEAISIFYTNLRTPDNKMILIPNGQISNKELTNYTSEATRRVDLSIGISYGEDIKAARRLVLDMLKADERVMQDPEPMIALISLGDNSVNLTIRFWTKLENYWPLYYHFQEKIYEEFPQNGLSFPFPQLDVHMSQ